MKIYIDSIFLENVIITLIFLYETEYIIKIKTKTFQKVLSSVFSGAYIVLMLVLRINVFNIFVSKILLAFVITYIAFLPKTFKTLIKINVIYFLITTLNIGAINLMKNVFNIKDNNDIKTVLYTASFSVIYLALSNIWKIFKAQLKDNKYIYKVIIEAQNTKEEYRAFLDTGNTVYSYKFKLPVIFAESPKKINLLEIKRDLKVSKTNIEITTLNNKTIETGYVFNNIKIWEQGEYRKFDAVVIFKEKEQTNFNRYNMLLNYNIIKNESEGEKI